MNFFGVSIDKVTLVGYLSKSDSKYAMFQDYLNDSSTEVFKTATGYANGKFLQFDKDVEEPIYFLLDTVNGLSPSTERNFRIEFNPNHFKAHEAEFVSRLMNLFTDVECSRLDIALDFGEDLSMYRFDYGRELWSEVMRGTDGKLETKYAGAKKSPFQNRIYNKKLERTVAKALEDISGRDVWWRDEYQLTTTHYIRAILKNDLADLAAIRIFKPNHLALDPKAMAMYLLSVHEPDVFASLPSSTKSRWRRVFREMPATVDISDFVGNELQKKAPEIKRQLNSWGCEY